MKKRLMHFILAMVLLFSSFDLTAFATEDTSGAWENRQEEGNNGKKDSPTEVSLMGNENTGEEELITFSETEEEKESSTATDAPVVTAVILSVNEGELRIRAWSASEGIHKVSAVITCTSKDKGTEYKLNRELERTSGYYTSYLLVDRDVTKIRVLVGATNREGKVGYKAAEVYPKSSDLEAEKVNNDLWIRFLDGEGKNSSEYTYTGKAIKPQVEIYEGAVLLTEKKDYTLSYKNNKNAGNAVIIVKGKGNYGKTEEISFTIKPKNIGDGDVVIDDFSAVRNGKIQKKVPKISYNKIKLSNKKEKDFTVFYEDSSEGAYQEPGIYKVRIRGNGNYTGEVTAEFSIGPKLVNKLKVSKIPAMEYTGQAVSVNNLEIKDGKNQVSLECFDITYRNNVEAGTASLIIRGNGKDYAGTKTIPFTITGTSLKSLISEQSALPKEVIYNGREQKPELKLVFENQKLNEGKDYQVKYKNNLNVGKATMEITGKGRFTGVVKHTFKIIPFDVSKDEGKLLSVSFEGESEQGELSLPFCKSGVKPVEEVRFNGKLLSKGKDYTLVYQNNKSVTEEKKAKVIVKMKGNFSKTREKTFDIYPQELRNTNITVQDVVPGKKKFGWKSKVAITDRDGKKLAAGRDYEKNIGYFTDQLCEHEAVEESYPVDTTLWVKIIGAGNYIGSEAVVSYEVKEATIAKAKVKIEDQSYTGRPVKISNDDIISVKIGKDTLTAGEHFEILPESYSNNVNKGNAKVILKGKNRYGGTVTASFKIVQKDFRWRESLEDNQQAALYEVRMQDSRISEFVPKNGNLTFTTKINTEPEGNVTSVKVNGTDYPLTKSQDGLYVAQIPGSNKAGSIQVEVTAVTVGEEEYSVSWNGFSEVLKDVPAVENPVWSEESGDLEFSFDLKDEDKALLEDSRIVITKEGLTVAEEKVKAGENKVKFTAEAESEYKVIISLSYDRDTNASNGKNEVRNEEVYSDTKTTNAITYKVSIENTSVSEYVEKNAALKLTTGIVVEPEGIVTAIKVNGKDYAVTKTQTGLYETEIPGGSTAGVLPVNVTAVTMNGEQYPVNWNGSSEVLKDMPAVENPIWSGEEAGDLEFVFTLKDEDKALQEGSRVVITKGNQKVAEEEVKAGENKVKFTAEAESEYKVIISLSYDRDTNESNGKNEVRNEEVYSDTKTTNAITYKVSIGNTSVSEYAEKNAALKLTTGIVVEPEGTVTAIKVNGKDYAVTKTQTGLYETEIPGGSTAGVLPVNVTAVTMNGEQYPVNWNGSSEVLKDVPTVTNTSWTEDTGKLGFGFTVNDGDGALQSGSCIVVTKGEQEVVRKDVQSGENKVEFTTEGGSTYQVSVQLNYDRDSNPANNKNEEKNKIAYTDSKTVEAITPEEPVVPERKELLELKNITSVKLYHQGEEVQALDISQGAPTNPQDYMVKIESETARDLYAEVEDLIKEEDELRVVPKLSGFMHYESEGGQMVEKENLLLYADNVVCGITSIQQLLEDMKKEPWGNFELTEDLDASSITTEVGLASEFSGTLDGNGYTIYNLNVPLFGDLYQATVKNLTIKNAHIKGKKGVLATSVYEAEVNNFHLIDSVIDSPEADTVGGIAEYSYKGRIINCSIENVDIRAAHTIGGVVGKTEKGAVIENVCVTGRLEGTRQGTQGAEIGGITGKHIAGTTNANGTGTKTSIENCYSQVVIQAPAQTGNGGIIGGPGNATAGEIKNSLSYAQGMCNGIAGFDDYLGTVTKVYQMTVPGVGQNTAPGITNIDVITQSTMTDLGLSDRAWELYQDSQNESSHLHELSQVEGYRSDRNNVYENLSKLAYVQNSRDLVEAGNALTDNDLLNKQIKEIYPVNQEGEYVAGLVLGEEESLAKIFIEFTDGSRKEVALTHAFTSDSLVAVYRSEELGITYHYDKYVSSLDEELKGELLDIVEAYTYDGTLDDLTTMTDRRQYKDYYAEETANNLEEFITLQMISQESYPFYVEDEQLKAQLKGKLVEELPQLVYTYNYINKWYDFDIGSLNPAKLLYFDGEKLADSLTQEMLVYSVVGGDRSNTNQTQMFFEKYIQPRTEKDLYEVLEKLISVAGYTDPNDWFKESFKGILREQNVLGVEDPTGIRYRIWDNMKMLHKDVGILLPVLSAPQEDMILVSGPTQVFLSTINRYQTSNTSQNKANMEAQVEQFCGWLGNYFGSIINLVPNAREVLNSRVIMNYDTIRSFQSSEYGGNQEEGVSQEPVFKWVNESIQKWGTGDDSAAYIINDYEIYYVKSPLFTSNGFNLFSHENVHQQDRSLFYMGYGRRNGAGAEYHADGVMAQSFTGESMTFNISQELDSADEVIINLSPQRVNTPEKLQDFYKDMFDVGYVLDYLIAQAFLRLDPAEQSKLVSQNYGSTYRNPTETELINMNLENMEDLIRNKLSIVYQYPSGSMGGYYIETFWNIKWYQPYSSTGVSDEASFKGFSHEMLGYAGYEDGFVTWLSGKSENDLDALRKITGDVNMTFEQYKQNRYDEVAQKINQIGWFDAEEAIQHFVEVMKTDAGLTSPWPRYTTELKRMYYNAIKRATKDFSDGNVYEMPKMGEAGNAQELAALLQSGGNMYIKLTNNIDVSQLPSEKGYYFETFSGVFDGNGYEISDQKAPLFNEVYYGGFKNMNFDVSAIKESGGSAMLSHTVRNVLVDGLRYDKNQGVRLTTNSSAGGLAYKVYKEIQDGEIYVSPGN